MLDGSLAGFFVRRHWALALVCGAVFFVDTDVPGWPRRSNGVAGVGLGRKSSEQRAEKLRADCRQEASDLARFSKYSGNHLKHQLRFDSPAETAGRQIQ